MRFRKRGGRSPEAEYGLPMTSLIDCIFLLLIFFMLTSSMTVPESQLASALQADRAAGRKADLQPQVVRVEVRGGESVFIIGQRVFTDKASLTRVLAALPKEGGVFVRVTDAAPVEATAAALQACKDAGFVKVSYVPSR